MDIALYPRLAPHGRIRVWVGVFHVTDTPSLSWSIDGGQVIPTALRAISSVRPDDLLHKLAPPNQQPRVFAGVYEFQTLETGAALGSDTTYRIDLTVNGTEVRSIEVRTLPDQIPAILDGFFNVLLVSCFHQHEDRSGLAGTIVSQLGATFKPHMTLLMGDQVYLDLPTLMDFPNDEIWLAKKFEDDYVANWLGALGYSEILSAAPSISMPDDHEFWNNYPHPSPFIGNSVTGAEKWTTAALASYEGFQLPYPRALGEPEILNIGPLSFFLPDMRTLRDKDRQFVMNDAAHESMENWVKDVIAGGKFAIFVSGQSLFRGPAGGFWGRVGDFELPNYGDYPRIMNQLKLIADAGLETLCLTGDVHWGRIVKGLNRDGRIAFHEVISSPTSLVTAVGADQVKKVGGFFGGLFGRPNTWPRHSDEDPPPDYLAQGVLSKQFQCIKTDQQTGNHVALLRFMQNGGKVEFKVIYYPIHSDPEIRSPREAKL